MLPRVVCQLNLVKDNIWVLHRAQLSVTAVPRPSIAAHSSHITLVVYRHFCLAYLRPVLFSWSLANTCWTRGAALTFRMFALFNRYVQPPSIHWWRQSALLPKFLHITGKMALDPVPRKINLMTFSKSHDIKVMTLVFRPTKQISWHSASNVMTLISWH